MFVLCGTDLQQEVLVFVSVEHQVGKLNFCLKALNFCGNTKLLPSWRTLLGLKLLPSRRATLDFSAQTISTAVPTVSSNKVEKMRLLRDFEIKLSFFQLQLSSTPLPAVLAAWRPSWFMDTSKTKESIAHWTFCCRVLYIKLLREMYSGMLSERWTEETFSKMYVNMFIRPILPLPSFNILTKNSRFLRILL